MTTQSIQNIEEFKDALDKQDSKTSEGVPSLDDDVFYSQFIEQDIESVLDYITTTINDIRKSRNWKSSDLKEFKHWRQKLNLERSKIKGKLSISHEEITRAGQTLKQFYKILPSINPF